MNELIARSQPPRTEPTRRRPAELPRAAAFWVVALTTASLLAASSAPSPLYPLYQEKFGFSTITVTVIFAVYVAALLISLLTIGRLSDFVGRRPVLAAALVLDAAAMAIFLTANGEATLVAARIVQGFATGAAVGVLGAYLLDLQPPNGSRLGSLINSVAPTTGLGLGSLLAGGLAQYAPDPTRLVFVVLVVLLAVLSVVTFVLPETGQRRPGVLAALRPRVAVPVAARRKFVGAGPAMISSWALGGLVLSVGGSLLITTFGQTNELVVGAIIGMFAACGALGAVLARDLSPEATSRFGTVGLLVGTVMFIVAVATSSFALFVIAAVVAGVGFGTAFLGALRAVTQLAEPNERAALLSAVYVVSYLAFSIPAVVAGVLATHVGLHDTAIGYGTFVAAVAAVAVILEAGLRPRPVTAADGG